MNEDDKFLLKKKIESRIVSGIILSFFSGAIIFSGAANLFENFFSFLPSLIIGICVMIVAIFYIKNTFKLLRKI